MFRAIEALDSADNVNIRLFSSAEDAWFWCCRLAVGISADKSNSHNFTRPCEANDLYIVLRRLYSKKELRAVHLKVMTKYGERQCAPNSIFGDNSSDCRRWHEAMTILEMGLREKGLIG